MIRSAVLRLTLWYLLIIMTISLSFSWLLYRISSAELARQYRPLTTFEEFFNRNAETIERLRAQQLNIGLKRVKRQLLFINLTTLFVGGVASYFLARRTLKPIEVALEAQSRFTADASHELRTPLAAMRAEIEVALRSTSLTTIEARTLLQSTLEEVGKLHALSEGLLRLAQTGERALPREPLSLSDVIAEAVTRVASRASDREIVVRGAARPFTLRGDRTSLIELVVILLDNALKYSPPKRPIEISLKRRGSHVAFSITDHGVGIPLADQPFIFDRFYRADSSRTKDVPGGYGLGLAIARQITEIHRGSIEVSSAPGRGSTFTVTLPLDHART